MQITQANLASLYSAYRANFQGVLTQAPSQYLQIATVVPSAAASNDYAWLGSFPNVREWLGDRVVHGAMAHGYNIKNKDFELTVAVPRNAIDDDQYGVYGPMMAELGRAAGAHPDQLSFAQLALGASTKCYDGQYFFDTDHPVLDANGVPQSQANWDNNSGSGRAWYLLDTTRALKPIIFQDRKKPQFVAMTAPTDHNVFHAKEYVYGFDSRCNVGYGFWQLAYGSRKPMTEDNIVAAIAAMETRTGDYGRKLGISPNLLVVDPADKIAAAKIFAATTANGGENVMKSLVTVMSSPWLS